MSLSVVVPRGPEQLDAVRSLMRAFIAWHRRRHAQNVHLIDAYFDAAAFDAELLGLPGEYVPPRGQLLLATSNDIAVGCVALRAVDAISCEMKRMFVYEQFHGRGVGHALASAIIDQARSLGYRRMLLDTGVHQNEAKRLYSKLGFKVVQPYYELPEDMRSWLIFMELNLQDTDG